MGSIASTFQKIGYRLRDLFFGHCMYRSLLWHQIALLHLLHSISRSRGVVVYIFVDEKS